MHVHYELANGNSLEARRLYSDRFPNGHIPGRKAVHQRLFENTHFNEMENQEGQIQ